MWEFENYSLVYIYNARRMNHSSVLSPWKLNVPDIVVFLCELRHVFIALFKKFYDRLAVIL